MFTSKSSHYYALDWLTLEGQSAIKETCSQVKETWRCVLEQFFHDYC